MVRAVSPEREATVIAEIRRTHAQLRNGRVTAEVGASGIEWSMRFTVEEVDVLLAIVDERDDLKRRLLEDWEGDELEGIPIRCNEREPGVPREARARRCELDAGHDGYHIYPRTMEDHTIEAGARPGTFIARPELRSEASSGCPRRDTIHDCPLGGCADASPREAEIPDVPECTDEAHAHCVTKLIDGECFTDHPPADLGRDPIGLSREARETPPPPLGGVPCRWCGLPIEYYIGAWHHEPGAAWRDVAMAHHPAEPFPKPIA